MGWKGIIRSIEASNKRYAREAERIEKHNAKLQALEAAKNAVFEFENYIKEITSTHKEKSSDSIDWEEMSKQSLPEKPENKQFSEKKATYKLENFKPNFFHRIFKLDDKIREKLKQSVEKAIVFDKNVYEDRVAEYQKELSSCEEEKALAERVINKEPESYLDVIKKYNPFVGIANLGSEVKFSVDNGRDITVSINVHSDELIPKEKYSLRQSGTLSIKNMPKGEFNELYQDHVCSSVLRIARELFALLPIERLLVNANDDLLNGKTGYVEEQTILSVLIVRSVFEKLNIAYVDPSDSMENFQHNMKFKKTSGFSVVEPVKF